MSKRSQVFVLALLGLLLDGPVHGYELRKRLNLMLGSLRAFSYGSLYPCLRGLVADGYLVEEEKSAPTAPALSGRRARVVYAITPEGREYFSELLGDAGPDSWEDDGFGVHFAFFRHADADVRLRILEGRRLRLEERRTRVRAAFTRTRERLDTYTLELQRYGLESVDREVRWLTELIADERQRGADQKQERPAASVPKPIPVEPPAAAS